jgi:5-methylcytosine-specific restriction endonuclease McrA
MEGSLIPLLFCICIIFAYAVAMWSNGENPLTYYEKEKQRKLDQALRDSFIDAMDSLNQKNIGRTLIKRSSETRYAFSKRIFLESNDWQLIRKTVFKMYGRRCMKCESIVNCEVDHIYPVYLYPSSRLLLSNLQVLCRRCNSDKGRKTADYRPNSIGESTG